MKKIKDGKQIIFAPISVGELVDKITILEIKKENVIGGKLNNIKSEHKLLNRILKETNIKIDQNLFSGLKEVNQNLWNLEDKIREKEKLNIFDNEFIRIARDIYKKNDLRSKLKLQINLKCNSAIVEEKSYEDY